MFLWGGGTHKLSFYVIGLSDLPQNKNQWSNSALKTRLNNKGLICSLKWNMLQNHLYVQVCVCV